MRDPPLSHHQGWICGKQVGEVGFENLDLLKQVMVERSREKHKLHLSSWMIVLCGFFSLLAIMSASRL